MRFEELIADGQAVETDAVIWRVRGKARTLLSAERTALNLTQRMSGVATTARRYVGALPEGSRTRITDTRKTTPGLRALERYAVRVGGASNHRNDLGSAVLIKDNHLVAAGGIGKAIAARPCARAAHLEDRGRGRLARRARAGASPLRADVIMLDNFSLADVHAAVARVRARGAVCADRGLGRDHPAARSPSSPRPGSI